MLSWHAVRRLSYTWSYSLFLVALFAVKVRAEPSLEPTSPPNAVVAYDQMIEQALQAYEAGRYAEARSTFRRAHASAPTARTLRSMGMCSFNLGDYLDAVVQLEQALVDARKPLTPEQQVHARDLLERANARIGRFRLRLTPSQVTLRVDGTPATVLANGELVVEAGQHEVEARAQGYVTAHSTLSVEGGDRTTLVFHLMLDEYGAEAALDRPANHAMNVTHYAANPRADQAPAPEDTSRSSWTRTLGYTSLGLGAASLLGFAVTGTLALADENKLQDRCPNEMCSEMYRNTVDRYNAMRTAATVTLVAGGVLAVLGTTLLIAQPATPPAAERAKRAPVEPILGLGAIGLRGEL